MNIGSIHHKISNTGTANSRAATQVAQNRGPADKIASLNRADSQPASIESSAPQDSELLLQPQPVDRIPGTRNNLGSQHPNDAEPSVYTRAVDQSSQPQQESPRATESERAIAFYQITETISSVSSQGELIGVDTYA